MVENALGALLSATLAATSMQVSETLTPPALEALYRHQMAAHSSLDPKYDVFCLSVWDSGAQDQVDPPAAILQRLNSETLTVRPRLQCEQHRSDREGTVFDRQSGRRAIFLFLSRARCEAMRCVVSGGYAATASTLAGFDYTVERRDGAWQVTNARMTAVF